MADKTGISHVGQASAEEQSMAQIREILFGEQSRETARHFAQLEAHLSEQEQALKALLENRIAEVNAGLSGLRDTLDAQDRRQGSALDELHGTLQALLARLDERVTLLDSDQQDDRAAQQRAAADQAAALDALEQRSVGRARLAELLESLAHELRQPARP